MGQGGSYDLSESLTNALNTTNESTGITVIGASEGDAVKSWVANGNTTQLNAQVALVSDKGYGVSSKNGNNGNQPDAIEGNESILFDLGVNATSVKFNINTSLFDSNQTLTGQ